MENKSKYKSVLDSNGREGDCGVQLLALLESKRKYGSQ